MYCIFQSRKKKGKILCRLFNEAKDHADINGSAVSLTLVGVFFYSIPGLIVCMPIIVHFFTDVTFIITCESNQ